MACAASCVYVDDNLGQNFIPGNQIYEVKIANFNLGNRDIMMGYSDSLSAYSSSRITVGSIRDGLHGVSSRSSAFTVVPVLDTIDVGENTEIVQFHFTVARDTLSYTDESQKNILQNIYVYELEHRLDSTYLYASDLNDAMFAGKTRITKGTPVYNGGDSLSFDFSDEFAQKFVDIFKDDPDIQMDLIGYLKKAPGIYLCTDEQTSDGGRINMFTCPIEVSSSYYVTGNYAELKIRADYGTRTDVDTSFLFYFGPEERTSTTEQYAFNVCRTEASGLPVTEIADNKTRSTLYESSDGKIYVEGGSGLKPVISAMGIKEMLEEHLAEEGIDPKAIIINKASLILPYEAVADYDKNYLQPDILSPACKFSYMSGLRKEDSQEEIRYVSYAGLTDASIDSENHGDINRSLDRYAPDISHHVQEILRADVDSLKTGRYDIWLLVMTNEVVTTTDEDSQEMSEYYQKVWIRLRLRIWV